MDEFELTFLPKKEILQKLKGASFKEMLDIYIPTSSKHPTLRIRKSGDRYVMTKKQPVKEGDSSHQMETTIPLTAEEFSDLCQLEGKRVSKDRYIYTEGKNTYEIDVFKDGLQGLVLVDVEFSSNAEKSQFIQPDWVVADVTQEEFIAGGMLCGKSYSDISENLGKFGYSKILVSK